MALQFLGPIVSTNNVDRWRHLLTTVFGLQEVAAQELRAADVRAWWGLPGHSGQRIWFQTPGTSTGIQVVELAPTSPTVIRHQASGYDCDALKVIDFYAPDFDAAHRHLEAGGYELKGEVAEYDLDVGRITEGHLWGPDGVVFALISGPAPFFSEFVQVANRTVSEVLSVSAPVANAAAALAFYDALGFEEVYRYEVTDHSFQKLVGAQKPLHIRAVNMGISKDKPYFGIIHYGLPESDYKSLADRAQLPHRGLAGALISVDDVSSISAVCEKHGYAVVAPESHIELAPFGTVRSIAVRAPHGVLHQIVQI